MKWMLPLIAFLLIAPFTPFLDLTVSRFFYDPETRTFYNNALLRLLFQYGEIFSFATGILVAFFFLASFFMQKLEKWRRGFLLIGLVLAIGPGLFTNVLFKGYWGRARPKQVIEFGGKHLYQPFWRPDFHSRHDPKKSFPSGHVAMGFYYLSYYFVGKRYKNRIWMGLGITLTLFVGVGLMIGRVAQGGHFLSDVLASAVLMWSVIFLIDKALFTWDVLAGQTLFSRLCGTRPEFVSQSEASSNSRCHSLAQSHCKEE